MPKTAEEKAEYSHQYYLANRERVLERNRKWSAANKEWFAEYRSQWRRANPDKSREATYRSNRRHPEKAKARDAVKYALRVGKLVRQPCEVCGAHERIHAHHEDYSKPLEVMWLCPTHHTEVHRPCA